MKFLKVEGICRVFNEKKNTYQLHSTIYISI